MAERLEWRSSWHVEQAWLGSLVGAFELIDRAEADAPCDPATLAACERYLARPNAGAFVCVPRLLN